MIFDFFKSKYYICCNHLKYFFTQILQIKVTVFVSRQRKEKSPKTFIVSWTLTRHPIINEIF